MTITDFFKTHGIENFTEGHCQNEPKQVEDLITLLKNPLPISILEIGFNAGHSSEIFLQNNPNSSVVSFDIGCHGYVCLGKQYMDIVYPNRHTLILGNSLFTIPKYAHDHPNKKFDLIFIDGSHDYEFAKEDLQNCMKLAHKDTIVIMDDTIHNKVELKANWTEGPSRAWKEYVTDEKVIELYTKEYSYGKGLSVGKYKI